MPGFLKVILQGLFLKFMREKIKQGSFACRTFFTWDSCNKIRLVSMAALGITTTASAVLVGFAFVAGSIIWLLPISRASIPYVFMGFGFFMVLFGSLSLRAFFKEEHWMEMSQAYTLIDKVTAMGTGEETATSMSGESLFAHFAKQAGEKMREQANNKPYPPPRPYPKQKQAAPPPEMQP